MNQGKREGLPIKTRIITALIALPLLVLLVLYAPRNVFNLVVTIVAALGLYEFFAMTLPDQKPVVRYLAVFAGAGLAASLCWQNAAAALSLLAGLFMTFAVLFLFLYRSLPKVCGQLGATLMGFLYLPLLLSFLAKLRGLEFGIEWIFLVLALVMVGDSAAYFVGSTIGKTKLYPAISPNKTVEGALGGLAGSLIIVLIFSALFFPELGMLSAILVALVVGAVSQLGDLFESMLKRGCEVKDSGTMIPGHGGMLDRLDSLLFAFPAAYALAVLIGT